MVAHMPTRISLLWTVVLLTLPCPLFLVYCFAVVPPVAVLVLSANLIEQEALLGLAAAALMIGEVAIILVAGRSSSCRCCRSISSTAWTVTGSRAAAFP
jgi:hypothetical protein